MTSYVLRITNGKETKIIGPYHDENRARRAMKQFGITYPFQVHKLDPTWTPFDNGHYPNEGEAYDREASMSRVAENHTSLDTVS